MSYQFSIQNSPLLQSFVQKAQESAAQKTEQSATSKGLTENELKHKKLMEACQDFESIFLSYMFKTMRSANLEDEEDENGLFGNDFGGDMFRDLFESEIAKEMAGGKGTGLASALYESLKGHLPPVDASFDPAHVMNQTIPVPEKSEADSVKEVAVNPSQLNQTVQPAFEKINRYHGTIVEASQENDVDPALLYAVIQKESSGNPNVISSAGAKGLMQLMDETASDLGVQNSFDPEENIQGGARYLKQMLDRFDGNLKLALAAYNAGPGNVERFGGVPPFKETRNYVDRVLEFYESYKSAFDSEATVNV